jgi:hypothetical protein
MRTLKTVLRNLVPCSDLCDPSSTAKWYVRRVTGGTALANVEIRELATLPD